MNQKSIATLLLACSTMSCAPQTPVSAQAPAQAPAPAGAPLLSDDVRLWKSYGAGAETSALDIVPVEGQPFREAVRLTTIKEPPRFWDYGATNALTMPLRKGDVLWASLWARRVASRKESGEAEVEVALLQQVDGKETRPLQRRLSLGAAWTQFKLPFVILNDAPLGTARLAFRYGYGPQSLEIGGVQILNYGQNAKVEDLPRTLLRYGGWEANAPWRKEAADRIEKHRKGGLQVLVRDANGKPVPNAQVVVRMKRHAFAWGTAINERRILDQDPDSVRYREILERHFNKVVFENALKWGRWIEPGNRERVLAALPWLEERNFDVRGHVMVWPSWSHLPKYLEASKGDPEALKREVSTHISDQTKALEGRLSEWDVANETYAHHDLLDILGREALADWFRQARAQAPKTRLFYNDYTMFQGGAGSQYFYDTVKSLKDSGAPIDAIGEQGHFASSPPPIPDVLATLDKFGALGLPIQITEFDINSDDQGLQTDFMRDFSTAVFSHPSVMGVLHWGFWEKAHWLPRAAMWDKDWKLKPHGQAWVDLTTKTWWTNAQGRTRNDGRFATRGFFGDYEISVAQGQKSRATKFTLSPQSSVCTITLP